MVLLRTEESTVMINKVQNQACSESNEDAGGDKGWTPLNIAPLEKRTCSLAKVNMSD